MAAEVWTMVAGGGASVVYSDTVAVRPPKRDEDLTIRRLDPDGGGSKTGNQNGFTWPGLWLGQRVGQLW